MRSKTFAAQAVSAAVIGLSLGAGVASANPSPMPAPPPPPPPGLLCPGPLCPVGPPALLAPIQAPSIEIQTDVDSLEPRQNCGRFPVLCCEPQSNCLNVPIFDQP